MTPLTSVGIEGEELAEGADGEETTAGNDVVAWPVANEGMTANAIRRSTRAKRGNPSRVFIAFDPGKYQYPIVGIVARKIND